MAVELHVWGPAFGLPSIDAECIAAVAFLNASLPLEAWTLVADHDPRQSPTKDFPALRDGDRWIGGFSAIVQHVSRLPGSRDLDSVLDRRQRADLTAFKSLLHSTAVPLVDLFLYASFQNYYHTTGPAWTSVLPLPLNYTIPPRRRAAARARTSHLGLSSLDVDTVHSSVLEDQDQTPSARFEAEKRAAGLAMDTSARAKADKPSILSFSKLRSKSVLDKTQHSTLFRLSNLLSTLCDPLKDLMGDKLHLLTDSHPTSLDCLVLGYVSLILYPQTPMSFLSETLSSQYPSITAYIRRLRISLLAGRTDTSAVLSLSSVRPKPESISQAREERGLKLPWSPVEAEQISTSFTSSAREICSSLPLLSRFFAEPTIQTSESSSTLIAPLMPFLAAGTALGGALASALYYFMTAPRYDSLSFENPNRAHQTRDFGDLGAALGILGNQIDARGGWDEETPGKAEHMLGSESGPAKGVPLVEVDVELDDKKPSL